jgi:hypothetical protein
MQATGIDVARGLLGAADVGDGPTAEQRSVVQHLLHGYFGDDTDIATLEPFGPDELAANVDADDHHRVVDLLVVVEYCRHPGTTEQADRVEEYVRALEVDEPFLLVARDALVGTQEQVMADWSRFSDPLPAEPALSADDSSVPARLRALGDCPPDSLGRAFFDFYQRWGIPFPGDDDGGGAHLVVHDFSHVLAGYEPDAPGELALQAMLTSATGFEHHFSGLIASLSLYEAGKYDVLDITPKTSALDRPGAAAELADAFRRGSECSCDFSAIDHLARVDDPLDTVRADCSIPALAT